MGLSHYGSCFISILKPYINWCMLLRRKVFIRILTLLQMKTLIETKDRSLKCLKRHYSIVRSMKNVAVSTHLGDLSAQEFPPPEIYHPRQKKSLMPGGQPKGEAGGRSWNCLMHNTRKLLLYHLRKRIHVMNKRVRWSYVYCTLDIDGPWFWSTDIKVLFLFERRICSIGNVNFFPFVTAVSVFA